MKKYLIICAVTCVIAIIAGAYIYKSQISDAKLNKEVIKAQSKLDLDNDNFDAAISSTLQLISTDPSNVEALLLLAASYAQKGSVEFQEEEYGNRALKVIEDVLALDPNNSEAYRIRGFAYEIMAIWSEATEAYNKSIELDPKNASTYANRGHMYDLLGNFANARADYNKAIELDNNESHAQFNLARLEARAGKFTEAKNLITQALENTTSSGRKAEMYQVLANMELAQGNLSDAMGYIQTSIGFKDDLPIAYVTRGEIARAELAERIFKQEPIPDLQQKLEAIVADAAKATSIYEGQTTAIVLVGKLFVLVAEHAQGKALFEKALTMIDADITLGLTEKTALRADVTNYIKILDENL